MGKSLESKHNIKYICTKTYVAIYILYTCKNNYDFYAHVKIIIQLNLVLVICFYLKLANTKANYRSLGKI